MKTLHYHKKSEINIHDHCPLIAELGKPLLLTVHNQNSSCILKLKGFSWLDMLRPPWASRSESALCKSTHHSKCLKAKVLEIPHICNVAILPQSFSCQGQTGKHPPLTDDSHSHNNPVIKQFAAVGLLPILPAWWSLPGPLRLPGEVDWGGGVPKLQNHFQLMNWKAC